MWKFNLSNQNKVVCLGLFVSTILIVAIAVFSFMKIQTKLEDSFFEFGRIAAKTLAIESSQIMKQMPDEDTLYDYLRNHAKALMIDNPDIAYVEFNDKDGNIIYTSKTMHPTRASGVRFKTVSPMPSTSGKMQNTDSPGTVVIGFTGSTANSVKNMLKDSIIAVFIVAWMIFMLTIIVNGVLISRELNILHHGVRQIAGGRFGYKLNNQGVSGNIKSLIDAFNSMSERLHNYEEQNIDQLTVERNKFEAVLMSIVNGVVVCDNADNVTLINKSACKMLGVKEDKILNTKIQDYKDAHDEYCFKEKIEQFKDTPLDIMEIKPIEFNVDVAKMNLKTIISPMFSLNQEYLGYLIVLINVTKEAEADKLKSQFISNVSHELRTPVTVLRTYADTLSCHYSDFDEETKLEFLGTLNSEIARLHKMVNDILDLSRVESPDANLEMGKSDIISVVKQAVLGLEVLADEKHIAIEFSPKVDIPLVTMNLDSIDRVMKNLISNAIKYSPENTTIYVDVNLTLDNKSVEVTVKDQGIGIEEKHLDKIFDRFYRVENEAHTVKGTGIGLNLVKTAIEVHHNGKVFVHSKPGEGSTFGFVIPIDHETINDID